MGSENLFKSIDDWALEEGKNDAAVADCLDSEAATLPVRVRPLTGGNRQKAKKVLGLLNSNLAWCGGFEYELRQNPGFLIGLRVISTSDRASMFEQGQCGVMTDVCINDREKIYVRVTFDNLPDGFDPIQRTVQFRSDRLWRYVAILK